MREALKDESQRDMALCQRVVDHASPARTTPRAATPSWKSAGRYSRDGERQSPHPQAPRGAGASLPWKQGRVFAVAPIAPSPACGEGWGGRGIFASATQ